MILAVFPLGECGGEREQATLAVCVMVEMVKRHDRRLQLQL